MNKLDLMERAIDRLQKLAQQYLSDVEVRIMCIKEQMNKAFPEDGLNEQMKRWEATKKQIMEVLGND